MRSRMLGTSAGPSNSGRARTSSYPKTAGRSTVMRDAAGGEQNSPGSNSLECVGSRRCGNPMRVVLSWPSRLAGAARRDEVVADRYSVAPLRPPYGVVQEARERSPGETPVKAIARMPWKGQNPREQPAVGTLNPCWRARDSRKGQSPETAACGAGPPLRRWRNLREKR
jgi:hypothetical protein